MAKDMPESCGLGPALEVIGGKWKTAILWEVHFGPMRFAEIRRRVEGISEKVLTAQLRELETDGIIERTIYPEVPPRVEYAITPLGLTLNDAVTPLAIWGQEHGARIKATRPLNTSSPKPTLREPTNSVF